jgi:hypothetical protein
VQFRTDAIEQRRKAPLVAEIRFDGLVEVLRSREVGSTLSVATVTRTTVEARECVFELLRLGARLRERSGVMNERAQARQQVRIDAVAGSAVIPALRQAAASELVAQLCKRHGARRLDSAVLDHVTGAAAELDEALAPARDLA